MAGKIERLLRPGELVIYRPRADSETALNVILKFSFFMALSIFAIVWVGFSPSLMAPMYAALGATIAVGFSILTSAASMIQARFAAVVTDQRVLLLLSRRPSEVLLGDIMQVHGVAKGSSLPMQIETGDGRIITVFEEIWGRNLGLAIAEATGLPSDYGRVSATERIAGLLYRSDRIGMLVGAALSAIAAMLALGVIGPALVPLGKPFALVAISLTIVALIWMGSNIGRVALPVFMVLCLRPRYGADEMRDAFRLLAHRRLLPREKDECRRLQPLIWWVAGLLYGRRFDPIAADGLNP